MQFLADMGVHLRVVDWLRAQGHDAKHLREEGLQRLPNGDIFTKAIAEKRVVLTFDLDFAKIAALTAGQVVSVVVFRRRNARFAHVFDRLAAVLPGVIPALEQGGDCHDPRIALPPPSSSNWQSRRSAMTQLLHEWSAFSTSYRNILLDSGVANVWSFER